MNYWIAIADFAPPTDRKVEFRPAEAPTEWLAETWTVFDHVDNGKDDDDLTISDGSVVPVNQGQELRFATAYESALLERAEVEKLVTALQGWLQRTAR
jgi:hypothetical protein